MAIVKRKATIYRICPFVAACQCGHRNRGLSIKQLRILVFAVEMVGLGGGFDASRAGISSLSGGGSGGGGGNSDDNDDYALHTSPQYKCVYTR